MRLLLALALLWAGPALAQDVDCADATAQAALDACADQEYQAADAALNAAYQDALGRARGRDGEPAAGEASLEDLLREAQRAWVAFRDAECQAEAAVYDGGSMMPMVTSDCLAGLTRDRTAALEAFALPDGQ